MNGQPFYDSHVSVVPGTYRIVVEMWKKSRNVYGYVELDAKTGRAYTARAKAYGGGIRSWAVDLDTCKVVAGTRPEIPSTLEPIELGCAEQKTELKTENIAAAIVLAPIVIGALVLAPYPIVDATAEECFEDCYVEPDAREESTSQLLIPPWKGEADEGCDNVFVSVTLRCLLEISIDGLHVAKNERVLKLDSERHALVFKVLAKRSGFFEGYFNQIARISISLEPNRDYALCLAPDYEGTGVRAWVVDSETGQTVAGWKSNFGLKSISSYFRFCPRYL